MRLTGILLAAGSSRRFGGDKRRERLPSGDQLAVHCARRMREVVEDVLVVLREGDDELAEALQGAGCRVTHNPHAAEGMGASIRHGVAEAPAGDGWLIMPADLPWVRTATIARVAAQLAQAPAVVPVCNGQRGHPVGFAARFREGLLALQDDRGARGLLQAHPDAVCWLEVDDPGIGRDVDRPEALRTASGI
jgi:molybdenum cofactor cytidylyltransferase